MTETEFFLALQLAWWVGVWNMLVALYFVFISGSRDKILLTLALLQGLLGGCVFILVRRPAWTFYDALEGLLLPFTLLLFLVFSVLVTILMWRAFHLDPPWTRVLKIIDATTPLNVYPPKNE